MKNLLAAVLVLVGATPVFAADAERDVMDLVVAEVQRWAEMHKAAPVAFASRTTGGAEPFVTKWMTERHGEVIGSEIGLAYVQVNTRPQLLTGLTSRDVRTVELAESMPRERDWTAAPEARSIVLLSQPAFDAHETFAVVRADHFTTIGGADTVFYDVARKSDGSWEVTVRSVHMYAHRHLGR
jgi:hypothetical protein